MKSIILVFGPLLLLAGCGDPASSPFDATVTFTVRAADGDAHGQIEEVVTTVLAVEKPGRTTISDAWGEDAPAGTQYGRHKFPPGTTAPAIVGYYEGLFTNAGWTDTDVRVEREAATIRLFGVTRIDARSDGDQVRVNVDRAAAR